MCPDKAGRQPSDSPRDRAAGHSGHDFVPRKFETLAQVTSRRKGHIKVLRKGGPTNKRVVRGLTGCRENHRCKTEACDVCMRRFRKHFLRAAQEILQPRPSWIRASIIPAGMAIPYEGLEEVDLPIMIKRVRKRLERSQLLADRIVLGGIDISLNLQDSEIQHWQLHLYLLIEGNDTKAVSKAIRKAFPPEPTAARPYDCAAIYEPVGATSYGYKSIFVRRCRYRKDGHPRTRSLPLKPQDQGKLLPFLARYPTGSRLVLHGVRRNGKPLKLQPTKP